MTDDLSRPQLKIAIVGHVDHGKSTLVGRLLHDTHSLPEGKVEAIQASCARRGMPFEWSFLLDALQTERDQGITIDTTQIWLRLPARDVVIIDAPGHKEFLKNMITGAAQADAALVLIDAREGIREQSRRHGYLLHLLGIRHVAVVVNKMDAVEYNQSVFDAIEREYRAYLATVGIAPLRFIPVSAREGDNIATPSSRMAWYEGETVLGTLAALEPHAPDESLPLRFPVQDVYKFDDRRIIAGRIESGSLSVGDTLLFSPTGTTARVASIETWPVNGTVKKASAGQSIGITLDEQVFVERGQVASHSECAPQLTNIFRARIFWLGHEPLSTSRRYKFKLATTEVYGEIRSIEHVVDAQTLAQEKSDHVARGSVAEVVIRARGVIALDEFVSCPQLGRFVIQQDYDVAGGGIISMEGFLDQRSARAGAVKSRNIFEMDLGVTAEQRALVNGHFGGVIWLTGLSGSGKSTIARAVHRQLFEKGCQVYVLDGDNIRKGLARDLGFSPEDRTENIRRVAEVAALFADAGVIVIASFISPYAQDRERARAVAPQHFHTVYVKASVEACEKRDTKGLYAKARRGEIPEFTGISAPYEVPENPDMLLDTEQYGAEENISQLMAYIDEHLLAPARNLLMEDATGSARSGGGTGI